MSLFTEEHAKRLLILADGYAEPTCTLYIVTHLPRVMDLGSVLDRYSTGQIVPLPHAACLLIELPKTPAQGMAIGQVLSWGLTLLPFMPVVALIVIVAMITRDRKIKRLQRVH